MPRDASVVDVLQTAAGGGGERRGQRRDEGGSFVSQKLGGRRSHTIRRLIMQAEPGKRVGQGSKGEGGITSR